MFASDANRFEFILESNDGGETSVYPARLVSEADYLHCIQGPDPYPDFALNLNESALCLLAEIFLEKYIDRSLVPVYDACRSGEPAYDHWGDNLFSYADIRRMLKEMEATAQAIRSEQQTPVIDELLSRINPQIFPHTNFDAAPKDLLVLYKEEIADYYSRFCAAVQSVMDNAPEYEYLDFCGP